jgi:hypothetical protein
MVFARHGLLCLVLRRIDCHPMGDVDGIDTDKFGQAALDPLIEHHILVQRSPLRELDGCPVQWLDGRPYVFDLEGARPPEAIDPRLLTTYEIDLLALCRALRRASQLGGPSVEALSDRVYFIGHHGSGSQRRSVCLARLLRDNTVLDLVGGLRARIGMQPVLLLTPGMMDLKHRTVRYLAEERVLVLPLVDALDQSSWHPFILRSAALTRPISSAQADGRLRVDAARHSATLDGGEILLGRLEFSVFSALAEEAAHSNGYVPRDDLLHVIEAYRHDPENPATPENLDNVLSRIRRALAEAAGIHASEMTPLVETKRRLGHRLGVKRLKLAPSDVVIL